MVSPFLGVFGSECLLYGGERDFGTSGITVVTISGSVGQKPEL